MGNFLNKILPRRSKQAESVTLSPQGRSKGNVLLSYGLKACIEFKQGGELDARHSTAWEAVTMARTFLQQGFTVDVFGFDDGCFVPRKEYHYFIDVLTNMERLSPLLNQDCVKIFHPCFSHWLFHNNAHYRRLYHLQQRKGLTLQPRRLIKPNLSVENADYITLRGQSPFCESVYQYAAKTVLHMTHSANFTYPWPQHKDFSKCRKRFLWLGGAGMVHKGLDLVLDAFRDMPEYELMVCGPVDRERDFQQAYYRELYETENIHTIGWVDVGSAAFNDIMSQCIALVHPSCSELNAGSVLVCMHGGLIPVASNESGVVIDEFGITLKECTVDEIQSTMQYVADLPVSELENMSRQAWECATSIYTREKFTADYRGIVSQLLAQHGP
jgi:glycosyltransferase involved in cell wall biosynthesis